MTSTPVSLVPPSASRTLPEAAAAAGFFPTPVQRRFVQLALAARGPLKIAPVCRQLGISRTSYYRWLDQPGFRGWMSAQWVVALQADGARLLSIAQARAASDFRYWRALADLIFDPRGLGLLSAWQQRLDSGDGMSAAPLFEANDADIDANLQALDGDGYETLMEQRQRLATAQAAEAEADPDEEEEEEPLEDEDAPAADPEDPAPGPPVPPSTPVESVSCAVPAVHFSDAAPAPEPSPGEEDDDDSSSPEAAFPWPRPAPGKRFWF